MFREAFFLTESRLVLGSNRQDFKPDTFYISQQIEVLIRFASAMIRVWLPIRVAGSCEFVRSCAIVRLLPCVNRRAHLGSDKSDPRRACVNSDSGRSCARSLICGRLPPVPLSQSARKVGRSYSMGTSAGFGFEPNAKSFNLSSSFAATSPNGDE